MKQKTHTHIWQVFTLIEAIQLHNNKSRIICNRFMICFVLFFTIIIKIEKPLKISKSTFNVPLKRLVPVAISIR